MLKTIINVISIIFWISIILIIFGSISFNKIEKQFKNGDKVEITITSNDKIYGTISGSFGIKIEWFNDKVYKKVLYKVTYKNNDGDIQVAIIEPELIKIKEKVDPWNIQYN